MVHAEARLVTRRINAQLASEMALLRMVFSAIPNQVVKQTSTKKAATELTKILKGMLDGKS